MIFILLLCIFNLIPIVYVKHIPENVPSTKKENVHTVFNNIFENMKTFIKALHASGHTRDRKDNATKFTAAENPNRVPEESEFSSSKITTTKEPTSSIYFASSTAASKGKDTATVSTLSLANIITKFEANLKPRIISNLKQWQQRLLSPVTTSPSAVDLVKMASSHKAMGTTGRTRSTTTTRISTHSSRSALREKKSIKSAKKPTAKTTPTTTRTTNVKKATPNPKCLTLKMLKLPLPSDCHGQRSLSIWS